MNYGETLNFALACGRALEDSIYYAPTIAVVCAVIATVIMIARVIFIPIAKTEDIHLGETVAFLNEQVATAQERRGQHDGLDALVNLIEAEDINRVDAILMQLTLASVASCTCGTKSPEPRYHTVGCRYRALAEAHDLISRAYGRPLWPFPTSVSEGEEIYQQGGTPPLATS